MVLKLEARRPPPAYLTSELGRSAIRTALRSGEYSLARRGAIVPKIAGGTTWEVAEARAMAAIAAVAKKLKNEAAFSHASAALVHGLWLARIPEIPEVTQETKPNAHGRRSLRRHQSRIPSDQLTTVNSLRVTTIERTIVDCACTMPPHDALVIADSGLRTLLDAERSKQSFDPDQLEACRRRLHEIVDAGPRNGRRQARAVIDAADPHAESPKETTLRWVVVARGLPRPVTQVATVTRGGTFYSDLGWRWPVVGPDGTTRVYTVLVEYDGDVKYLPGSGVVTTAVESAAAVLTEKRREDLIRERPDTTILRVDKSDLRDPDGLFAWLLAAIPPEVRAGLELAPIPELLIGTASRR